MVEIIVCPICQSREWRKNKKVLDHSVSKEEFDLNECKFCSLLATSPRPNEINLAEYYKSDNYISHSGSGNNLINKVYLVARSQSLKWKLNLVNDLSSKGKILDVGCGTGEFLNTLKKNNWSVSGIEPNRIAREKASKLTSTEIKESFSEISDTFDIITLWHVLEHLPNLEDNFNNILKALKLNGTLLIAVPNHKSFDAQQYKEYWAGYDVPRHLWHFNQNSMVLLLQKYGLSLKKIIPMKLDAFYVSILSEKYRGNNSMISSLINGTVNGFKSNRNARITGEYSSLIYIASR